MLWWGWLMMGRVRGVRVIGNAELKGEMMEVEWGEGLMEEKRGVEIVGMKESSV